VKIGIPSGFSGGLVREIENPAYATAVGLIYHGFHNRPYASGGATAQGKKANPLGRIARKFREFIDAL